MELISKRLHPYNPQFWLTKCNCFDNMHNSRNNTCHVFRLWTNLFKTDWPWSNNACKNTSLNLAWNYKYIYILYKYRNHVLPRPKQHGMYIATGLQISESTVEICWIQQRRQGLGQLQGLNRRWRARAGIPITVCFRLIVNRRFPGWKPRSVLLNQWWMQRTSQSRSIPRKTKFCQDPFVSHVSDFHIWSKVRSIVHSELIARKWAYVGISRYTHKVDALW